MELIASLSSDGDGDLVNRVLWLTGGALIFFVLWMALKYWAAPEGPLAVAKTVFTVLLYVFAAIVLILFICRVTGFSLNL